MFTSASSVIFQDQILDDLESGLHQYDVVVPRVSGTMSGKQPE